MEAGGRRLESVYVGTGFRLGRTGRARPRNKQELRSPHAQLTVVAASSVPVLWREPHIFGEGEER